jgi:hypothetical protein
MRYTLSIVAISVVLFLNSCSTMYYNTMEKFGYQKRDLLVSRIEDARDAQTDAKTEFVDALDAFDAVVQFDGGDLEDTYYSLKKTYEICEKRATDVRKRIDSVQNVAEDLFEEWEAELAQYNSISLRRASEDTLRKTERRYAGLISRMRAAEEKMPPVLTAFNDQVLFLKHNLNAKAIASLDGELEKVSREVNLLIQEMQLAIDDANAFIEELDQTER